MKLEGEDKLLIGCVYRPPSNTREDNDVLYKTILSLIEGRSHVLIGGDFNHSDINWKDGTLPGSELGAIFMDFVHDSFLFQHVTLPTHYRGNQTPTLIDLVFSNEEGMVQNVQHEQPIGKSHHVCICFDYLCYTEKQPCHNEIRYNYMKGNYDGMREYVTEQTKNVELGSTSLDDIGVYLGQLIQNAVDKFVPASKRKDSKPIDIKRKPRWWSSKVSDMIDEKSGAFERWTTSQDMDDWVLYKKVRNRCKNACRWAEREYERNIAAEAKNSPKLFYSYVNSKMKVRESIGDLADGDGNLVSDDEKKACILNNFFCSVFTKERLNDIPKCEIRDKEVGLGEVSFTKDKVLKKLLNINPSKSSGPDGISAKLLKELAVELSGPIATLFQKSMDEGRLPSIWKKANVVPIYKNKGDKKMPNNYRPVSLTCILCKIMESIIRDELVQYLTENKYLSENQHGFMSKRSCTTNLLATLDAWTEILDNGNPVDTIYLDFAKAFDSVPHIRLMEKVKSYGVCSQLFNWIKDFLEGRTQRVGVNGCFSNWSDVTSGVPQGSCLGPVLFVIFINDLPDVVESLCQMYADDTKVFSNAGNQQLRDQIQKDLDNLVDWADKWQMRFNADKCHVVHMGFNNINQEYYMKNHDSLDRTRLKSTLEEKDLGVLVDNELSFVKHIAAQVGKANRVLGQIRRTFSYLDKNMMRQLFIAFVRPHLEFGNVVWSPHHKKYIDMIERVQRRATKCVPGLKDKSYEERLSVMKLPSLKFRRKRGDFIELYKYTHGLYSVNESLIHFSKTSHTRGHSLKLEKRSHHLDIRKFFFTFRTVETWNKLPEEIVNSPSVNTFKTRFDQHFSHEMYQCAV